MESLLKFTISVVATIVLSALLMLIWNNMLLDMGLPHMSFTNAFGIKLFTEILFPQTRIEKAFD